MKRLIVAVMLAAFTATLALPVIVASGDALAAEKKKKTDKTKAKMEKKKPASKM